MNYDPMFTPQYSNMIQKLSGMPEDVYPLETRLLVTVRLKQWGFLWPWGSKAPAYQHWLLELQAQMVRHMEELLCRLVDSQGGCEKIQKTPMPFAYVVMLKQIIVAYLLTMPLVLCERCGWWTPLLVGIAALGLLGMEEASVEIEDPFGTDENCLNLEALTLTIARDTGQLADRAARRASGSTSTTWSAT